MGTGGRKNRFVISDTAILKQNPLTTVVDTYKRYVTLKTHKIQALPIVILMPHSSCNCRCIMCDIWQGNSRDQLAADLATLDRAFPAGVTSGTRYPENEMYKLMN